MGRLHSNSRGQVGPVGLDRAIAAPARGQHGVVSRERLTAIGLSRDAIDHRVALGRLHVLHRGVYAVGHTVLGIRGHWMAALGPRLRAGRGAEPCVEVGQAIAAVLADRRAA